MLLDEVAQAWLEKVTTRGINPADVFLVVSSLGRTLAYQNELIEKGYPAADESSHTKLGAFDIATAWFSENRPELLEILNETLEELALSQSFNEIDEPDVGARHIAWNPTAHMSV